MLESIFCFCIRCFGLFFPIFFFWLGHGLHATAFYWDNLIH